MAKSLRTSSERVELPQEANAIAMMRAVARWIIDFMDNSVILSLVVVLVEFPPAFYISFIMFFCIIFVTVAFHKTFFYKLFLT